MHVDTQRELLSRVRKHVADGTTDMSAHALRIAAAHYVDAAVQDEEVQRLFRTRPVLLGLTPDVPEPGCYVTRELVGWPLLLVRGEDGVARTFVNACKHRGARLAEGRGQARSFSCPFHAWNYARDGRLIARAGSCEGFSTLGEGASDLTPIPTRERAGMIFALIEAPAGVSAPDNGIDAALDELIGPVESEIASYGIAGHQYFDSRSIERNCNYKLVMDTFTEAYHIAALHKDSIRPYYYSSHALTDRFGPVTRMIGVRSSVEKEWAKPDGDQRFVRHGTIQYLMPPNIVFTHQVDHLQLWHINPILGQPGRCSVNFSLYWPRPVDADGQKKAQFNTDIIWKVTNDEDFPQCENANAVMTSGALPEIVFGRNEPGAVYYHRAMDAVMAKSLLTDA